MKDFFIWCGKIFDEDPGVPSALRVVVVIGLVAVTGLWVAACIWHKVVADMPPSVLEYVGMLLGAKVGQKFVEK